jgi:Secretion system C-terminal sorting domain
MNNILTVFKKCFVLSLCYLHLLVNVSAQRLPVGVDQADVQIFPSKNSQHEVHISINKTNPTNLIVSANTLLSDTKVLTQGHYISNDGGITWTGSDRMPNNQEGRADPSTSFDASGRGYVSTINNSFDGYLIQFTDDQGVTWSNSIRGSGPNANFDKEMITTTDEMQTSAFANNFYCAWTDLDDSKQRVFFNRSTDRAATFGNRIILSKDNGQGTNVQTGPNGEVYVCWANYPEGAKPGTSIGFASSFDGGISFTTIDAFLYRGIRKPTGANANFGGTRINDYPVMAVDKSCGPNRGRIYIAYPEFESTGSTKSVIRIRFSDDKGVNWSDSRSLSDPDNRQSWFPWIAIDDLTGLVSIVYYSFDKGESNMTNTFLSFSLDGILWSRIKVSDVGHNTAPIPNMGKGYAGDYIGVAAFGGVVYTTWADDRTGIWQVFVSKVTFNLPNTISSQTNLVINQPIVITGNQNFQAANSMEVANLQRVTIGNPSNIEFVAGKDIMFHSGFEVTSTANFLARIDQLNPCTTPGAIFLKKKPIEWQTEDKILKETKNDVRIFAYPNPTTDHITVGCLNNKFKEVAFSLTDVNGKQIYKNVLPDIVDDTQIRKVLDLSKLNAGTYFVTMIVDKLIFSTKIIKQ